MELIDCIRLAVLVFFAAGYVIVAMYPTHEDAEDYENWIDYHDKEARERRVRDRQSLKNYG